MMSSGQLHKFEDQALHEQIQKLILQHRVLCCWSSWPEPTIIWWQKCYGDVGREHKECWWTCTYHVPNPYTVEKRWCVLSRQQINGLIVFAKEVIELAANGGFRFNICTSNRQELLGLQNSRVRKSTQSNRFKLPKDPVQCTLDVKWNDKEDVFFCASFPKNCIMAIRGVVSLASSIFDQIGPFTCNIAAYIPRFSHGGRLLIELGHSPGRQNSSSSFYGKVDWTGMNPFQRRIIENGRCGWMCWRS